MPAFLSRLETALRRIGIDRYMMLLVGTVLLATLAPARGEVASGLKTVTFWAVSLLFFLYGAKLSTASILSGLTHWRLQGLILLCTFGLFPLLGLVLNPVAQLWLPAAMGLGFLYIGCLPSTVQSSIAFTSVSGGNVAGAVCAASISNLLAVLLTPLLLALLVPQGGEHAVDAGAVWAIIQQILLPFGLGQLARPWLAGPLNRHKLPTMIVDRGSILLIVYAAFSAGMVNGIWQRLSVTGFAVTLVLCLALFATAVAVALGAGRLLGLQRGDLYTTLYCGSTKSLATGLPMAGILFAGPNLPFIVLPLMIYHLMQLVLCALIAQRAARSAPAAA